MQEDRFRQAVVLAQGGQKAAARALLQQLLQENPRNETAWLWFADCASTLAERASILETCLRINPGARMARLGLEKLHREMGFEEPGHQSDEPPQVIIAGNEDDHAPDADQTKESAWQQSGVEPPQTLAPEPSNLSPLSPDPASLEKTIPTYPPEHRLPVQQFPAPSSPGEVSRGQTKPVHVSKPGPADQEPPSPVPAERETPEHIPPAQDKLDLSDFLPAIDDEGEAPAQAGEESGPGPAGSSPSDTDLDMAYLRETLAAKEKKASNVKIFDREPPRPVEPNPFTVTPGEYPQPTPHTPVIKPLKAQIERRLERDLGLDVPPPPEPTQRIRVRPKQNRANRGMILLYIAIALIGILGIAALLAGLILSGR